MVRAWPPKPKTYLGRMFIFGRLVKAKSSSPLDDPVFLRSKAGMASFDSGLAGNLSEKWQQPDRSDLFQLDRIQGSQLAE